MATARLVEQLIKRGFEVDGSGWGHLDVRYDGREIIIPISASRADASQRLAFGLCKKFGIKLSKDDGPKEAWAAIREKTGKTAEDYYGEGRSSGFEGRWKNEKASGIKVKGPKASKKYADDFLRKNPKVKKSVGEYADVMDRVRNFDRDNPGAEDGTYDALTGKMVDLKDGFCVTFHQNLTEDNTLGGYDKKTYAKMCAVAKHQLKSESVYIGHYGNPEVSFHCSDMRKAMEFAVEHNQESIWDCAKGRLIMNPFYNKKLNPIKGG